MKIEISREIGTDVTASQIRAQLKNLKDKEPIEIEIYSCPGGSVIEAFEIYNLLKPHSVTVNITGLCASSATIIAMSADKGKLLIDKETGFFLVHRPSYFLFDNVNSGDSDDIQKDLEIMESRILDVYENRSGSDRELLKRELESEAFTSNDRAIELKLVDGFITHIETKSTTATKELKNYFLYVNSIAKKDNITVQNNNKQITNKLGNTMNEEELSRLEAVEQGLDSLQTLVGQLSETVEKLNGGGDDSGEAEDIVDSKIEDVKIENESLKKALLTNKLVSKGIGNDKLKEITDNVNITDYEAIDNIIDLFEFKQDRAPENVKPADVGIKAKQAKVAFDSSEAYKLIKAYAKENNLTYEQADKLAYNKEILTDKIEV